VTLDTNLLPQALQRNRTCKSGPKKEGEGQQKETEEGEEEEKEEEASSQWGWIVLV
jgi:ribosomal protein L12E/L44/L45/RPP1/RPP2